MPVFTYEALDNRGRSVYGQISGSSVESVVEELRSVHYIVTDVKQRTDVSARISEFVFSLQGINLYTLAVFTRQFATILNAGIPLLRGLEGLVEQVPNRKLGKILYQVLNDLKSGFTLTRSLQKHPKVFSPVFVALVRAGEMAGALSEIFNRLAVLLEKEFNLRKKVETALTYPAFVFALAIMVTIFLVAYIFPQFVSLLEGLDLKLPWPTMVLIYITNASKNMFFVGISLLILGVCLYLFKQYFSTPLGRRQIHKLFLDLPVIGKMNRKLTIARFCRTLSTLLSSGVPLLHSLEVVSKVANNDIVCDIIEEIKMSLRSGEFLSTQMKTYPIFPPIVHQMVAAGEEVGSLPYTLEKLADFYDEEVEMTLESAVTVIEPLMIFVMGGIVGFVMMAVFLPIYTLLERF
jgi:type IV pilus assembly protein PilC